MNVRSRLVLALMGLTLLIGTAAPALAGPQLGAGLHYLRTLGDIKDIDGVDENAFGFFGSVTIPVALVQVEGDIEFIPDYLGSDNMLIEPSAYGFLNLGLIYGGLGIGIGYLDGEWATNPHYSLRGGVQLGLEPITLDIFTSYRFQSASYDEVADNFNMDALTFGAQVKFGG